MGTFVDKYAAEHGLTKVDAKKPTIICVNQKDVDKAKRNDSGECAFAMAAKRNGASAAFFLRNTCYIQKDKTLVRYRLPPSAQKEIVAFDRARAFEPGNYQLSVFAGKATLEATRKRYRGGKNERHKKGSKPRNVLIHRSANIRTLDQ